MGDSADVEKVAQQAIVGMEREVLLDEQPRIEGHSLAISYDSVMKTNFSDRHTFATKAPLVTKVLEETSILERIDVALMQGRHFANMLYTSRSCAAAMPVVKSAEQDNRQELYEASYRVLEPEVVKVKGFMKYQTDAISLFTLVLQGMVEKCHVKTCDYISNLLLERMIELLDRLMVLDLIKNMKASLNNDFAYFRRAFQFLRAQLPVGDDEVMQHQIIYLFLANQNAIFENLRKQVSDMPDSSEPLLVLLDHAVESILDESLVLPTTALSHLRAIPYLLVLADSKGSKDSVFKAKRISSQKDKLTRLIKLNPVVPLYADMHLSLVDILSRSSNFEKKWLDAPLPEGELIVKYQIHPASPILTREMRDYMSKFSKMFDEIRMYSKGTRALKPRSLREIAKFVFLGVRMLSRGKRLLLDQICWKYSHPNEGDSRASAHYEKVIRYNFTPAELSALIEFIAVFKGMAAMMKSVSGLLSALLRSSVHHELQVFIQEQARDMLRLITKKKISALRSVLLTIRLIGVDWLEGKEPQDPAVQGKKWNAEFTWDQRRVAPTATQIDLIRNLIWCLLENRTLVGSKTSPSALAKKHLLPQHLKELETFYANAAEFAYMLEYDKVIDELSNLSWLWFKEFYLTLCKVVQVPIEMSLPSVMVRHVLASVSRGDVSPALIETVLYPLDIYNDAANEALHTLDQQFLYDEIQAELSLSFDQMVYQLSELIYTHFRTKAKHLVVNKALPQSTAVGPTDRIEVLLKQRHVQLLGRSLDLNSLLGQRMANHLSENLENSIARFEASPLSGIVELESLLSLSRTTSDLLSEFLPLSDWDSLLAQVDENTSLFSQCGRIARHVTLELISDVIPNFVWDARSRYWKRSSREMDPPKREPLPKTPPNFLFGTRGDNANLMAYLSSFSRHDELTCVHWSALVRVLGAGQIPMLIGELFRVMSLKFINVLSPYVMCLTEGLPPGLKPPSVDYGARGALGYYQLKLDAVLSYPDLFGDVLPLIAELGNSVAVVGCLEEMLSVREVGTMLMAAPLMGVTPFRVGGVGRVEESPLMMRTAEVWPEGEGRRDALKGCERAMSGAVPAPIGRSLVKRFLDRFEGMVGSVRSEWEGTGEPSANEPGVFAIENSREFVRLWSGFCFAFAGMDDPVAELGTGFVMGGVALLYFMDSQWRWKPFDFANRVVECMDASPVSSTGEPDLERFASHVRYLNSTTDEFLIRLESLCPRPGQDVIPIKPPSLEGIEAVENSSALRSSSLSVASGMETMIEMTTGSVKSPLSEGSVMEDECEERAEPLGGGGFGATPPPAPPPGGPPAPPPPGGPPAPPSFGTVPQPPPSPGGPPAPPPFGGPPAPPPSFGTAPPPPRGPPAPPPFGGPPTPPPFGGPPAPPPFGGPPAPPPSFGAPPPPPPM